MAKQIRNKSIRLDFYYKGRRCRETIDFTGSNLKTLEKKEEFADQLLGTIKREMFLGTFSYQKHFPNSKKLKDFGCTEKKDPLFKDLLERWLMIKATKLMPSTYKNYESKSKNHIEPKFGNENISSITKSDIELWIAVDLKKLSNKTINEILVILRGVFKDAKADELIDKSPIESIDNLTILKHEPDPFSRDEMDLIFSTESDYIQEINLAFFNSWAGLRVSELFALSWDDIDQINWTAHIQIARVENIYKVTKTYSSNRTIELLDDAINALKAQLPLTFDQPAIKIQVLQADKKTFKTEKIRPVFLNTHTMQPHCNYHSLCDRFWKKHLKKAGVRYRPIKTTRHTYASQLLSTGKISKEWIIGQMGHTSSKMFDEHYAKWISKDAPKMAKLASEALRSSIKPFNKPNQTT